MMNSRSRNNSRASINEEELNSIPIRNTKVDTDSENELMKSSSSSSSTRNQRIIRYFGIVVLGVGILVFAFVLGGVREKRNVSLSRGKAVKGTLSVHWAGSPIVLSIDGDKDSDACSLLSECFSSEHFIANPTKFPENPLKMCHATVRRILTAYDSGFFFEGRRLVGFVSSDVSRAATDDYSYISVYNVCVRREDRGRGVAKAMLPQYIDAIAAKRLPGVRNNLYVGLDVDFDTPDAIGAFALYAKMGFNRWWEACRSISYFDYAKLQNQVRLPAPQSPSTRPSLIFPMSQMILTRDQILSKSLRSPKGVLNTHFCMVMLWGKDDFGTIGRDIKNAIQEQIKANKQPINK